MRRITILMLFFSCLLIAQFAVATDNLRVPEVLADVSVLSENLDATGKAAALGGTIDMYLTTRSVQKSKHGKHYFYKFNKYGQLISVKRIRGVERQFAYANPSARIPQLVKIGKRPWAQLPHTKSSSQRSDVDDASLVSQQTEVGAEIDLRAEFQPTQYEAYKKDGADDDEYDDEQDFDWILDIFDVVPNPDSGGGSGGGSSNGYCQTRHCSFPSLAACMADCDRTKDWGQAACGAFSVVPERYSGAAAIFLCLGAINSAYTNICKPGCEGGSR